MLFIDDLKMIAKEDIVLSRMVEETKKFFYYIGLDMNKEKSATNSILCSNEGEMMEGQKGYKYLGIIEDSTSKPSNECIIKIKNEIINRLEKICKTQLNAKNLFKAINERAISLINYYVGVLKLETSDFSDLDHEIRQVLIKHSIHMQPACKERLYIPRQEMGRGLQNVEFKSEQMLFQLYNTLNLHKNTSTRRAAILKVENDCQSHLSQINTYIQAKYNIKTIVEIQKLYLISEISKKDLHKKLFKSNNNPLFDIESSSVWLSKGNIRPRNEASFCNLQDRNIFLGAISKCQHCNEASKTVDHLATRCDRMLYHDYTRRHNEIVKCLHLLLCNKYGLKSSKKLRGHSVQEIVSNEYVEIRVDTRVKTDIKVQNNRPDIFVFDKKKKEITLIEIGVTNQDLLQTVETEKTRKYDILANELSNMYKCKTKIIPFVITWNGLVTVYHKKHIKELEIPDNVKAYIQTIVLKKTLENISFEHRRELKRDIDETINIL